MSSPKPRTTRPIRAKAPPLPAFDALDETHREIMQTLEQMTHLLELLQAQGADDDVRRLAKEVCKFFGGSARAHHRVEEELVFPGLLGSGDAELVAHVQRLRQDHGWLEEDWLELGPQLGAVSDGYNAYDLDTLRAAIPIFAELYRDHIALEEAVIYPEARRRQALQQTAREARKSQR